MATGKPTKPARSRVSGGPYNTPQMQTKVTLGKARKNSAGVQGQAEQKAYKGTAKPMLKKIVDKATGSYSPLTTPNRNAKPRMNGKATGTAKGMLKMITKKAVSK